MVNTMMYSIICSALFVKSGTRPFSAEKYFKICDRWAEWKKGHCAISVRGRGLNYSGSLGQSHQSGLAGPTGVLDLETAWELGLEGWVGDYQ